MGSVYGTEKERRVATQRGFLTVALASVFLCVGSAAVFQRTGKLLVCQAGGNPAGAGSDPGAVLHL